MTYESRTFEKYRSFVLYFGIKICDYEILPTTCIHFK